MNRITVIAYALGGGCFAIILSGLDPQYCDTHPLTVGFLAAGIPTAVGAASACESTHDLGFTSKLWWVLPLGCFIGIAVAFVGILMYFVNSHPAIRNGFLYGLAGLLGVLWRFYERRVRDEQRK